MQLQTITELFNLPNFQIASELKKTENSIHLYTGFDQTRRAVCSAYGTFHHSQSSQRRLGAGRGFTSVRKRVFLYVPKRKVRCLQDGKIRQEFIGFAPSLPTYKRNFSMLWLQFL